MHPRFFTRFGTALAKSAVSVALAFTGGLAACGGHDADDDRVVRVVASSPNTVSYWNDVANRTVNAAATVSVTPEEQRPSYHVDLATVHVAIYDAVSAIDGRFMPFAVTPASPASGASLDAAASAAAYGALRALYPNRGAQYQAAYDSALAAIAEGPAKAMGVALGTEVAAAVVALRANDGRAVALAPYVSSSAPGRFRSANATPFNRYVPSIKPFSLTRVDQFRPAPPPPLSSAEYTASFNESKAGGGVGSAARTPAQLESALFHSEVPALFVTRNLGRFAASTSNVVDAARLMAWLYVAHGDAITACFEAKYFHDAWRPLSAIPLADADGNVDTAADPAWTPVVATPNHPEYPAAHSCTFGALGETLRRYHGTSHVVFDFDSNATHTTRTYEATDALNRESEAARIHGGMHFRYSTVAGVRLGTQVADWVADHHFARRP